MPTITKTIIAAGGGDYTTFAAWHADLNNVLIYSSGDIAKGNFIGVFDENFICTNGSTIGLAEVIVSGDTDLHDGTEGSGARVVCTSSHRFGLSSAVPVTFEWMEWDWNGNASSTGSNLVSGAGLKTIRNCIIHGSSDTGNNRRIIQSSVDCVIHNNIFYDHQSTGVGCEFIRHLGGDIDCYNNTFHDCSDVGIDCDVNTTGCIFKNNIVTDCVSNCFELQANNVKSHNLSSDTTAAGTGSLTSKAAADQFESVTGGSENLHLKSGADAIDAGTDLGTTPTGVNIDIDGRDRDAEGDTWDMGAHELVAAAATGNPWNYYAQQQAAG